MPTTAPDVTSDDAPVPTRDRRPLRRDLPGLYALKPWYTRRLARVLAWAVRRELSPDAFTAAGVLAAAGAAPLLATGWWAPAGVLLALRLAGANLDGAVARSRRVARPWGFVLNELGDRAGDLLMFAGLAALAANRHLDMTALAVAVVAASLPTFVSLAAAGAGATRRNGGPLGKTERCVLAVLGCAVPALLVCIGWLIVAGSVLTALLRCRAARRELTGTAAATVSR